jgi:hypothetical protein
VLIVGGDPGIADEHVLSLLAGIKLIRYSHFLHLVFLLCFLAEFRDKSHPKTFGGSPARKSRFS